MAKFQTVPFIIAGPTYQSRSKPLSSQLTVNMYQQFSHGGKENYILHSFPGQRLISSVEQTFDRGVHRMAEVLYRVVDDKLYQVDENGVHFEKGTVTGGSRCIFADDGENLVIVADVIYIYNVFLGTFTVNDNVNLVNVISVTFINNQFIYTTKKLSFMSAPGDPTSVSGLDAVGAESSPDEMVRDYVFNQTIFRFGARTTELWYNSGSGKPPIDRIEGRMFSVGLGAIYSLTNTDKGLYWLGDDNAIYRTTGSQEERISNDGITNTLSEMSRTDDALGNAFSFQGQDFYMITFPTGGRTFVINESLGEAGWFNLASTNLSAIYSGTSIIDVYGKNIVIDSGKLLVLAMDEYTQDSDVMIRQRITSTIDGSLLGVAKGTRIKMSRIKFIMEAGVGLISGQGVLPRMMIEPSYDGGKTFVGQDWVELGRMGENTFQVEWDNIESFYEMTLRLTISDPVAVSIYSATIDLKLAGR